jgi:MFS family permease
MCLLEFGILKVCLIGVCFSVGSVIFTLGSTLIGEIAPPAQRGAMLGITNSVQTLAGLCAPLVMGQIIDSRLDPQAGFRAGFLAAGGLVAALGILAAVLIDPAADKRRLT